MKLFALICLYTLFGCASAKKIMTPSGKQGYIIKNCNIEGCYELAAETCPKGYKIFNKDKSVGSINGQVYTSTTLLIECKKLP